MTRTTVHTVHNGNGGHPVRCPGHVDTYPKTMYNLQKYKGISSRYTCPQCGRPHEFVLYVDESGNKLADNVGRCNRESSCGYHYTPKQYFLDHPEARGGKTWQEELQAEVGRRVMSSAVETSQVKPAPLCVIPDDVVRRSIKYNRDSNFITFLRTLFDPLIIEGLIGEYRLGVARNGSVIFYQLDIKGRCRTGKIMQYDPETGHRIKDENVPGRITWTHSLMKKLGQLPESWELSQCLFGEHLLAEYPDKPVALVESEKTAVICAGLMPKFIWLATGGKSQINDRLLVLKGRKVVAFPDVDGFQEWTDKLARYTNPNSATPGLTGGLQITVSTILQQNVTPEDLENHIDIADWLIRLRHGRPDRPSRVCHPERSRGISSHSTAFLKAMQYIAPEYYDNVEAFIEAFELCFVKSHASEHP